MTGLHPTPVVITTDLITRGAPAGADDKPNKPANPPKACRDTRSQRKLRTTAAGLPGIDVADTIDGAR